MLVDRGGRYRTRREMRSIAVVRTAVTVVTMPWHGAGKPVVVAHAATRLPSGGTVAVVSNISGTASVIGIGPVGVARGCISARRGGPTETGHTKNRDDGEGDGGEGLVHDRFLSECLAACGNAPFAAVHLFRRNDSRWRYEPTRKSSRMPTTKCPVSIPQQPQTVEHDQQRCAGVGGDGHPQRRQTDGSQHDEQEFQAQSEGDVGLDVS